MNALQRQAQLISRLKYEPQRTALGVAQQEAQEAFQRTVQGGRSSAQQNMQTIHQATPAVAALYQRAEGQSQDSHNQLATLLAGLGPGATGYRASAATEAVGASDKLGRERARTLGGLHEQEVAASAAPAQAQVQASQQLAASLAKIFATGQSIASGEGLTTASELTKLTDAQRKEQHASEEAAKNRATTERGQNLTRTSAQEAHNPATPGGTKPLTPKEQLSGRNQIGTIKGLAQHALQQGRSREQVEEELQKPGASVSGKTKGGQNFSVKGRPAYAAGPVLNAALDEAQYGYVTHKTINELHASGYTLKQLGVKLPPRKPIKHFAQGVAGGVNHFLQG